MKDISCFVFLLVSSIAVSACDKAPDVPADTLKQSAYDSLFDGEYKKHVYTFKSFTPNGTRQDTVNGKKVSIYPGVAVVAVNSAGVIGKSAYHGDGKTHRWKGALRNYKTQSELDQMGDPNLGNPAAKAQWMDGAIPVKAGDEIQIELTVACWYGTTNTDSTPNYRCYQPENQ